MQSFEAKLQIEESNALEGLWDCDFLEVISDDDFAFLYQTNLENYIRHSLETRVLPKYSLETYKQNMLAGKNEFKVSFCHRTHEDFEIRGQNAFLRMESIRTQLGPSIIPWCVLEVKAQVISKYKD